MIIRHAGKPVGQINGVDASGNQDPNSLIPQGWQRAGALVALFGSSFGPLPAPTHLFAPNQATNKYSFNQQPQLLLQGDLPTPLLYAAS
jgi:hypothetical protein